MSRDVRISAQDNGYLVIADPDYEIAAINASNNAPLPREKRMVFLTFDGVIEFVRAVLDREPPVDIENLRFDGFDTNKPDWAKWWACHANGEAFWFEEKPFPDASAKAWGSGLNSKAKFAGHLPPPDEWHLTRQRVE